LQWLTIRNEWKFFSEAPPSSPDGHLGYARTVAGLQDPFVRDIQQKLQKQVLMMLRSAFECPQRCIKVTDDRRPRVTLLLLEHLSKITRGEMQADIEEAKQFVLQRASKAN